MSDHSNEPWRCLPQSCAHECDAGRWSILPPVVRGDDHTTPRTIAELPPLTGKYDAKRIVACINALAGLNPEHVGELVEMLDRVVQGTNRYHGKQCCEPRRECAQCCLLDEADALLAKVKVET